MSLKAKLEAVIYAAEEPVTLAQLAVLFSGEALELKAEREAANANTLGLSVEEEPAVSEEILDQIVDSEARTATAEDAEKATAMVAEMISEITPAESAPVEEPSQEPAAVAAGPNPEEAELEARRQARVRDREAREVLRGLLDELIAEFAADGRGIEIREIAGGFRMGTKPEMHDAVRAFVKSLKPPMKLSLPALETLAVIAYKQPVTAPEVGEIRGVDSAGVLGSLISRKLIATAGRKQVIGRPMLYKTTKEFLLRFGLKDLSELPSMEEFEKMAALELSEGEESDEAAAMSGDLFAPAESPNELEEKGAEITTAESDEVSTVTAEASQEAADEQAPVERQDAEEIEA